MNKFDLSGFKIVKEIGNAFLKKLLIIFMMNSKIKKKKNPKLDSVILLFKADFMNDPKEQTKIGRCYIENYVFDQNRVKDDH